MATEVLLAALARANLAAGAAILLVLFLRRPVRVWFGAQAAYALWIVPLLAAVAVLLPARVLPVPAAAPASALATFNATLPAVLAEVVERQTLPPAALVEASASPAVALPDLSRPILATLLAGAVLGLGLVLWRQRQFLAALGRLIPAEHEGLRVHRAETTGIGPAVVGVLRPRIVVPADFEARFTPEEQRVVLAHERAHLARQDSRINGLVVLLQCAAWFNPLVHLAALALRLDQELACDAAVVARFPGQRRRYAEALLKTQMAALPLPLGCHWPPRSAHPLNARIAMIGKPSPNLARRLAGAGAVAAVSVSAGFAAWASQPPRLASAAEPARAEVAFGAVAPRPGRNLAESTAAVPTSSSDAGAPLVVPSAHGPARRTLTLPRGESRTVELPAEVQNVTVSDPNVADVIIMAARRLEVQAAETGQTNVEVVDATGRRILDLDVRVQGGGSASGSPSPYSAALTCLADYASRNGVAAPRIAVGRIGDETAGGKNAGVDRLQRSVSLMAMSAFAKAGSRLVEVTDRKEDGSAPAADFVLTGELGELNFNIRSEGPGRNAAVNVAMKLRLVETRTGEPVDLISYDKRIVGREIAIGRFRFFDGVDVDIDISRRRGALALMEFGLRTVVERSAVEMMANLYGAGWTDCRHPDPLGGRINVVPASGRTAASIPATPIARPLPSARQAIGDWVGSIRSPGGDRPVWVHIQPDIRSGRLKGTLNRPGQKASQPLTAIGAGDGTLQLAAADGARYRGTWDSGTGAWNGELTEDGVATPLSLQWRMDNRLPPVAR